MPFYAGGVDVGSTQTKGIIMDERRRIVGRGLTDTGANVVKAAEKVFALALADAGLSSHDVSYVVGTGYGRYKVTFGNTQITEISCHAKGATSSSLARARCSISGAKTPRRSKSATWAK